MIIFVVKNLRAMREVWPKSVEKVNLVEPSQSMQRAGRSLIQGVFGLLYFLVSRYICLT